MSPKPRKAAVAASLLLLALSASLTAPAQADSELKIAGGPTSATDTTPIQIDAELRLPIQVPAPAVILAHGFGGSKESVAAQAEMLTEAGFVTLTYSARGFGTTIGQISMNSPEFEIADARALVDYLAAQPEVAKESGPDPWVAVAGGSYGGALSLMLAGYDPRVDAVAADITWHNLETALLPQNELGPDTAGVFKKLWAGYFFSVGLIAPQGLVSECGRFALEWCLAYNEAATTGQVSAAVSALMYKSSPASIVDQVDVPVLLSAGLADSLFPLSEADATARQIQAAHPDLPLKVIWHSGGHDGGISEADRLNAEMLTWFKTVFDGKRPKSGFEVTLAASALINSNTRGKSQLLQGDRYQGVYAAGRTVTLQGKPQQVLAPAGGEPAAISVLPGLGGAASLLNRLIPGQSASFTSKPLTDPVTVVGSSRVKVQVSSARPVVDAVLFASLRIVSAGGQETQPNGLITPIRIPALGPDPVTVEISLPAIAYAADPGDSLKLVLSTTDFGYQLPTAPAVYTIELAEAELQLSEMQLTVLNQSQPPAVWLGGAAGLGLLVLLLVWLLRPRPKSRDEVAELAAVPLAVRDLAKEFKGGLRAVDGITYEVPAGEVIGLLGPNGAGKTTTMRMAMGLIRPTEGDVFVFGQRVHPGAPVLARIGSLVEGAGFLPHLTGRQNLELYWRASGRTGDPGFEAVLEIADLGTAVERKVRTYSQGMRQRLGIAQAMLGMPDLLMLDEPTNGLDPPQIRAMREVMQSYAATGRTVIVSSHLLSEVEQTCSYVVVMHRGKLVTRGRVEELLAGRTGMRLEDFFLEVVGDDLTVGKQ